MTITSDTVTVNKPAKEVFDFLADLNNLQKIMPEQVEKWTSTADECHFTVKGMASLGLKVIERVPDSKIALTRNGNAPFEYTITCHVAENGLQSNVRMVFESDMNMMMKMMAETAAYQLFEYAGAEFGKGLDLTPDPSPKEGGEHGFKYDHAFSFVYYITKLISLKAYIFVFP